MIKTATTTTTTTKKVTNKEEGVLSFWLCGKQHPTGGVTYTHAWLVAGCTEFALADTAEQNTSQQAAIRTLAWFSAATV